MPFEAQHLCSLLDGGPNVERVYVKESAWLDFKWICRLGKFDVLKIFFLLTPRLVYPTELPYNLPW
jgi:hypothetical protein